MRARRAFVVVPLAFRRACDEEDAIVAGFFFVSFALRRVIGGLCLSFCFPERASRLTQVFRQGQLRAGRA